MLSSVPFASITFLMREAFSVERISIEIDPVLTGRKKIFKDFFSLYRGNNYLSHKSIMQMHFFRKHSSRGFPTELENYGNSRGWVGKRV